MGRGVFITLEGIEGSGKTTQSHRLAEAFRADGHPVLLTHEPGGTRAGELIRTIFLDPTVSLGGGAELLLALADRAQHVQETLKPALARGEIVISDRYRDSTTAYQGYGRGLDLHLVAQLNDLASDGVIPDLTIVLDCAVETGLARAHARHNRGPQPDRFEAADTAFHQRVRDGFIKITQEQPRRFVLIDSSADRDRVWTAIYRAAQAVIERQCR